MSEHALFVGQRVERDFGRGPITGYVKRVAKDGSWAIIEARTGLGATLESRKYAGDGLSRWKPVQS